MCTAPVIAEGDEPDHHDRPEERRHPAGAARLHREQHDQNDDGERQHVVLEGRRRELQAFDRRQHRDRRRDHASCRRTSRRRRCRASAPASVRRPSARDASAVSDSVPPSPLLSARSRIRHVFDGDDDDQRPDDQRQHAEHDLAGDGRDRRSPPSPPRGTRRAGWCRYRRRRRRRCRASAPRSSGGHALPVAAIRRLGGRCRFVHGVSHGCRSDVREWTGRRRLYHRAAEIEYRPFRLRLLMTRSTADGGTRSRDSGRSNRPESAALRASA